MRISIIPALLLMLAMIALGPLAYASQTQSTGGTSTANVYKMKCSMCHGLDGKGYSAIHTPDFTSPKWQSSVSNQQITTVIENGKKGTSMPAWKGKLQMGQIEALVQYIRSLNSEKKK
jgi:mono/diheme cytochrome c family protein